MKILSEIKNRWTAASPIFFKKLQAFGLFLSGISGSLLALPTIPDNVQKIAGYALTAGAVLTFVSKLPVADPCDLQAQQDKQ